MNPRPERRGEMADKHQSQVITGHARMQMMARWISETALSAVIEHGRVVHVRGAKIHVIGRREVTTFLRKGVELADFEGIHVVCSPEGVVLTAYRNRDLRGLRPRGRRYHRRQMA